MTGDESGTCRSGIYRVTCDDCDLNEEYNREGTALGRKLAHHDVRGHRVGYEEVSR